MDQKGGCDYDEKNLYDGYVFDCSKKDFEKTKENFERMETLRTRVLRAEKQLCIITFFMVIFLISFLGLLGFVVYMMVSNDGEKEVRGQVERRILEKEEIFLRDLQTLQENLRRLAAQDITLVGGETAGEGNILFREDINVEMIKHEMLRKFSKNFHYFHSFFISSILMTSLRNRPVCDDGWNNTSARVACRVLGYRGGVATNKSRFGSVEDNFIMDNVKCGGEEQFLFDCEYKSEDDCSEGEGAGVICS